MVTTAVPGLSGYSHMCGGGCHAQVECKGKRGVDLNIVPSPINVKALFQMLHEHPDRGFVDTLVDGFMFILTTGIETILSKTVVCNNNKTARNDPEVVSVLLKAECLKHYTIGLFNMSLFTPFRINPL